MGAMKDLDVWFNEKYNKFDEGAEEWIEKNILYLTNVPLEKGNGIRIVVIHKDEEDGNMSYAMDLYEGEDYKPNASPDDIYKVLTETIDAIMVNMPKD